MKNYLPPNYPDTWLSREQEWWTLGESLYLSPNAYEAFVNFNWDENIGVVFLMPNNGGRKEKYAICFLDLLRYKENLNIERVIVLGYTDDDKVAFTPKPTPLAKKIDNYPEVFQFQYLERFYVGIIKKMSELKPLLFLVASDEWLYNKQIIAF